MAARSARTERAAVDPALPFKRRARRRLVGAVLVALLVATGLPFVLDPEPTVQRPEIRVDIPSRDLPLPTAGGPALAPVESPAQGQSSARTSEQPVAPPPAQGAARGADGTPSAQTAAASQGASTAQSGGRSPPPLPSSQAGSVRPQSSPTPSGGNAAPQVSPGNGPGNPSIRQAPGSPPSAPTVTSTRWVVQAGLFARAENATSLVSKIKAMGLPAYTEAVDTGQGARLRVRVGPFASRGEADQARARLSLNGIDAALVSP
jgi:DedD protein